MIIELNTSKQKSMIFHYPGPLSRSEAKSASKLRPLKMMEAFSKIGFKVYPVIGYGKERKESIRNIKKLTKEGESFSFIYSESLTMPTLLSEKDHIPRYPLLDYSFFSWAKNKSVPIGLFYRDIHWRFSFYNNKVPFHKRLITKPLYYYDWMNYIILVDMLFIPSLRLIPYLPHHSQKMQIQALPPGCDIKDSFKTDYNHSSNLKLLYIGGVVPPIYDLTMMLSVINKNQKVSFTICCREEEWIKTKNIYQKYLGENITTTHYSGENIDRLYKDHDALLFTPKETTYSEFAMPYKIFESIGFSKPVITLANTSMGEFISNNDFGWTVSSEKDLEFLLSELIADKNLINYKKDLIEQQRQDFTWQHRAKEASELLLRKR